MAGEPGAVPHPSEGFVRVPIRLRELSNLLLLTAVPEDILLCQRHPFFFILFFFSFLFCFSVAYEQEMVLADCQDGALTAALGR